MVLDQCKLMPESWILRAHVSLSYPSTLREECLLNVNQAFNQWAISAFII